MALPPQFLEELRARTPISALIGRRVRLAKSGKQWKGCCPFHGEKTPSFYVYDDGFHCFGCGAHGDAISFVMQSEGAGFMEAVERLAGEAGLEVPKSSPTQAAAEQLRVDLNAVLAMAAKSFQRRLFTPDGARALSYLRERGLSDDTIAAFGLGWSGDGRGSLTAELVRQDATPAMMLEAGLLRDPGEGQAPRELFYNRVMFPIRDRRGREISFGGRILGDGQPKYVNGPETPLFSKRRTLFALDRAREGSRAGADVVVVEGYMDVIALHQAGFGAAVAPLGTALTEEQLEELWRLSPSPVLCFDGDAAGGRAAARAADLALPMLSAERGLRLASLPTGEDPDTLVRRQGPAGFRAVIATARPLSDALYDLVRESQGDATPEQRAGLRAKLIETAGRIGDKSLASEYRRVLLDRFFASRPFKGGAAKPVPKFQRRSIDETAAGAERTRNLVAILLRHPELLHDVEEAFGGLELTGSLPALRECILDWATATDLLDTERLIDHLNNSGFATSVSEVLSTSPTPLPICASVDAMPAEAEAGWWEIFGLMNRKRLEEEVEFAERDLVAHFDQARVRRLLALRAAHNALRESEQDI